MAMILGHPWVVNGQPIATEAWRPEFVPAANSVSSALLWVRLPQLPLEFWSDSILRSIVRPAGDFQFADTSTMAKARGGFARVCVRIDLSKPLRPGARIRGHFSTFWQQFSYEHLEGICSNCGSLHFSNPCSLSPNPDSPSLSSKFGPWMAALRQRRPPPGAGSDLRRKKKVPGFSGDADPLLSSGKSGASPSKPSSEEGWTVPTKLARRRTMKTGVLADSPGPGTEAFLESAGVPVDVKRAGPSETQPESTPNEASLNFEEIQMQSANPFSLFGSAKWAGRPKACMDVRPGPSKRARPEESTSSRAKSKNTKGKGKVSSTASKLPQMIIIPSTIPDPDGLAPNSKGGSGGSSSRVTEAPSILPQQSGSCHDLALSRLKGALQGQGKVCPSQEAASQGIDTTDSMEATPLVACSGKVADDRPIDDEMSEDQVGSQSLSILK